MHKKVATITIAVSTSETKIAIPDNVGNDLLHGNGRIHMKEQHDTIQLTQGHELLSIVTTLEYTPMTW